ncbi:hypothetical protein [Desulfovibrio aminophilus]|uniref:hypothetical protein n=1 Tax=Desulfovibrio aminophilus TaxID=81425 RepID=UPI00339767F4
MREIVDRGLRLAVHLRAEDMAPGLSFFSDPSDFVQVGTWNYGAGKVLAAHNHNRLERAVTRTQEVLVVLKGRVLAHFHGEDDAPAGELAVGPGEVLVLLAGGHGYEILEEGTVVVEVKNGPYAGPDADRRRLG